MAKEWVEKLRDAAEKAIERTKVELEKFKEPKELEDALDKFELEIQELEKKLVDLDKEKQSTQVKIEQKRKEKKIAIKKLKNMK